MAPIFYYSFPLESELASVLWIDLYCWPWVKECFWSVLEDTLAFLCPLMSDGSQNRDTVAWFLIYLLLTMGDFRGLSADRRTKGVRHQIPTEALVTSHGHGLYSYPGVQPSYKGDWVQEGGQVSIRIYHHWHQRWTSSKANEEPTTLPWLLFMVTVIFIEKTIVRGAADHHLWIIVTSRE